jgi:hypothetical protein
MVWKKFTLPELEKTSKTEEQTLPSEPYAPIIEPASIVKVTSKEEDTPIIFLADAQKPQASPPPSKSSDPSGYAGAGWRQFLLSGDPISVTQVTNTFQEPSATYSGQTVYQYTYQVAAAASGLSFQVSLMDVWNLGATAETVAFRFGPTGVLRFIRRLNPNAGTVVNLINSIWRGPTNTAFNIYTFEPSPFVTYTILGNYQP